MENGSTCLTKQPSEKSNLPSFGTQRIDDRFLQIRFDHEIPGYAVFFVRGDKRRRLTPYSSYKDALAAQSTQNFLEDPPLLPGGEYRKAKPKPTKPKSPQKQRSERAANRISLAQRGDLVGQRFGQLLVRRASSKTNRHQHRYWDCECDCGVKVVVRGADFFSKGRDCCNRQHHAMLERRKRQQEIETELEAAMPILDYLKSASEPMTFR